MATCLTATLSLLALNGYLLDSNIAVPDIEGLVVALVCLAAMPHVTLSALTLIVRHALAIMLALRHAHVVALHVLYRHAPLAIVTHCLELDGGLLHVCAGPAHASAAASGVGCVSLHLQYIIISLEGNFIMERTERCNELQEV